ncbi:MAG: hypothetical protein R6V10_03865 [bacterium]
MTGPAIKQTTLAATVFLLAFIIAFPLFAADTKSSKDQPDSGQEEKPVKPTPEKKKKIKKLISIIESKPTGVFINNRGRVKSGPEHRPYNPDGSRNENFRVVPETESGEAAGVLNHKKKRGRAVKELISMGRPAVPQVVGALMHEGREFRYLYAYILGEIGDPRAVPALIKYMEDGKMKLDMKKSYEKLGKKKMARQMEKEGRGMISDAAGSLEAITGEDYGPDLRKWKAWWKRNRSKYGPPIPLVQHTANPPDSRSRNQK